MIYMRKVKTIDNITKKGLTDLGEPATEATVEALKAIPGMYRVRVVK